MLICVSHRYNDRNLYEKAGNFFIGIGPMISGTLFIILSFKLLLPNIYDSININSYFILKIKKLSSYYQDESKIRGTT